MKQIIIKSVKVGSKFCVFPIFAWLLWYLSWESSAGFPKVLEILEIVFVFIMFISYFFYGISIMPLAFLQTDLHQVGGLIFSGYGGGNFFEIPSITFLGLTINIFIWFIIPGSVTLFCLLIKELISQTILNK